MQTMYPQNKNVINRHKRSVKKRTKSLEKVKQEEETKERTTSEMIAQICEHNIHQVEQGGRHLVGRAFWLPRGLSSWLLVTRRRRKRRDTNDCATMHRHLHSFRHTALTGSIVVGRFALLSPIKPVDGRCSTWIWNSTIIWNSSPMSTSMIA